MTGTMTFYDEPSAWGLIRGDDERIYVMRGGHVIGAPPRVGDKVLFDPEETGRARRALAIRRT